MSVDEPTLTLALVLTGGGVVVASAFITGFVQLLKQLPGTWLTGRERLAAFFLSALLVVIAIASAIQAATLHLDLETGFAAFLAWYGIARLAMANYADATGEVNGLRGQKI